MGDGYINFGVTGGVLFMFFLGLLFSVTLNGFYKNSKTYPVLLLFTTMVFFYPIRPDCELQTSLGHLFKSIFLIFVIFQIWKYKFVQKRGREVSTVPEVQEVQRSRGSTFKSFDV
jgi:predicted membrane protein